GKSRTAVTNTLRLFQLPPTVQRLVAENQLGEGHARALLATPDRAFQEALARRTVAEGLSVRTVEQAVRARIRATDVTEEASASRRAPAATGRLRHPGLLELEGLLSEHLATTVKVDMTAKKGRVVIEFATLEDLERLYRAMTESTPVA
ncbi:MAG: ParB/RepB/Spo0J family partition protein, partial [Acidimicrobiales bacterium]